MNSIRFFETEDEEIAIKEFNVYLHRTLEDIAKEREIEKEEQEKRLMAELINKYKPEE